MNPTLPYHSALAPQFSGSVYRVALASPLPEIPTEEQSKAYFQQLIDADKQSNCYDGPWVSTFPLKGENYVATGSKALELMKGFAANQQTNMLDVYVETCLPHFLTEAKPITIQLDRTV